jgi:fructan beta-fructosidase
MTIPRQLKLTEYKGSILIASQPVEEINGLKAKTIHLNGINVKNGINLNQKFGKLAGQYILKLKTDGLKNYSITLSNDKKEELIIGFDKDANQYYIDRTHSGQIGFSKDFGRKHIAPRLSANKDSQLTLVVDASSVELFADDGATVMTSIFFPVTPYSQINLQANNGLTVKELTYSALKSGWNKPKK